MFTGDWEILRLGDNIPLAETLKLLSRAPPLVVLKLLNGDKGRCLHTPLTVIVLASVPETVVDLVSVRGTVVVMGFCRVFQEYPNTAH